MDHRRARQLAALLAALAAGLALLVSTEVFPYHSVNHDEAVYLQQAELLLAGQLATYPPVPEAFRPWFFVAEGGRLYSKYAPVVAGVFAVGGLLGDFRLALAGVAAATVGLLYAAVAEAFDRRTGLVAACLLLVAPLFVVQSGVFLPYLPTLALALLFAWAYLRADRTGDRRYAALAGAAIGLAFFARPYTAVLFAAPFLAHAAWTLRSLDRAALTRQATTAAFGLAGVALALAYNAVMTGSATTFPYHVFAPHDGIGFGRRRIVGYERLYDLPLALRAHARALTRYVTRWTPAGPLGSLLAAGGLALVLRRGRRVDPRQAVLAGLVLSITVGQLYFWGTLNALGNLDVPGAGLIYFLGPYYHVGLLVPTTAFGAVGLWWLVDLARERAPRRDRRRHRAVFVALLAVAGLVVGGATISATADPIAANADVTDRYEQAYEPFEDHDIAGAQVFLPTPQGDWLNHPFQRLRNDPGFDAPTVYAIEERPFAVVDATADRERYRYVYRGNWLMISGDSVTPYLQPVEHVSGRTVDLSVTAGAPVHARSGALLVSTPAGIDTVSVTLEPGESVALTATVANGSVVVDSPRAEAPARVPLSANGTAETVELLLFVDYGTTSSFSYRVGWSVATSGGEVRALTPELEVCRWPRLCGGEAAYVPGTHLEGVYIETEMEARE